MGNVVRRVMQAAIVLALGGAVACAGGDSQGDSSAGTGDGSIPARDLSLAELAGLEREVDYTRVARRPVPSASLRLQSALERGDISPAAADATLLRLALGRIDDVAPEFLEGGASRDVPDFAPYAVLKRLGNYTEEEAAELHELIDAFRGGGGGVAVAEPPDRGLLGTLLGPEPAYANTTPATSTLGEWVEVEAEDTAEQSWVPQVLAIADQVWPEISAVMNAHPTIELEISVGDRVRFREPLPASAAEFFADNGLPADSVGLVRQENGHRRAIEFDGGSSMYADADDIEHENPSARPIKIYLTTTSATIPNTGDKEVGGSFIGCRNLWVVTGDAGQCTVAGRVVHELFHCAQASRAGFFSHEQLGFGRANWAVEGSAMWAMDRFRPGDDHEWAFMEEYASTRTFVALDMLAHYGGIFFNYAAAELGGDDMVRHIYDTMRDNGPRDDLRGAFDHDPEKWHRFVYSTTGYEELLDDGYGIQLQDAGGGPFPFPPTVGCEDDGSVSLGQEFKAGLNALSSGDAPIFDLDLPGPSAQHEIVQLVDVEQIQYIDVAFFGDLGERAATADPDIAVTAVLITESGANVVQDWTDMWSAADGQGIEINEPDSMPITADTSFRICMTDDEPCQDAETTFADLSEIRIVFSYAAAPPAVGETLQGDVALVPGAIRGWTGKFYRRGTPEEEHESQ